MVLTLHILTACSRPAGLSAIGQALGRGTSGIDVRWHIALDVERQYIGGQAVKNRLLDGVYDGYVWVCDDDNLPHPAFFARLADLAAFDRPQAWVFSQAHQGEVVRRAHPGQMQPGLVDIAQIVARRDAIGMLQIPEQYDGDGHWIATICQRSSVRYVDEPLTLYNAQRWQ